MRSWRSPRTLSLSSMSHPIDPDRDNHPPPTPLAWLGVGRPEAGELSWEFFSTPVAPPHYSRCEPDESDVTGEALSSG